MSDSEHVLPPPEAPHFAASVALFLGGSCLLLVALLSRGGGSFHQLPSSGQFLELAEEGCFMEGMYYADPHRMPGSDRSSEPSAQSCQSRCLANEKCAHFTYWPDGGCLLTDSTSYPKAVPFQYLSTVIGPRDCSRAEVESSAPVAEKVVAVVAALPGINGTACASYPACEAAKLSGNCCPNDEHVSLGCCGGFPPKATLAV
ncbi:unnamed protein product [Effrenium voratum]|uniref:Apple domain-containing protein n=1 Tax=Effrenium voratum TaxID=2562239 RepID=A0AA36HN81_9DINO|nr:unnamed protein product [Effrenium voratum]CAJ1449670.1 unnamed protein product [Effrenium voratum]